MKMLATLSALCLLTLSTQVTASGGHGHGEDDHDAHEQETTGPNGGHLLKEQDITVEVLKTEKGGLASLHAWVTRDHKPVDDLTLSATLTRLDGVQKTVTFQQDNHHWKGKQKIQPPHSFDVSFDLKLDGEHHQWQWPSYEGHCHFGGSRRKSRHHHQESQWRRYCHANACIRALGDRPRVSG